MPHCPTELYAGEQLLAAALLFVGDADGDADGDRDADDEGDAMPMVMAVPTGMPTGMRPPKNGCAVVTMRCSIAWLFRYSPVPHSPCAISSFNSMLPAPGHSTSSTLL